MKTHDVSAQFPLFEACLMNFPCSIIQHLVENFSADINWKVYFSHTVEKKEKAENRKVHETRHSPNDLLLLFDMAACVVENNP